MKFPVPPAKPTGPLPLVVTLDVDPFQRFREKATFAGGNISPALSWTPGPAGTKSYALLMTDPDVPANLSLAGQPGVWIPAHAPRQTIYHWVLADIPPGLTFLSEGAESTGPVPKGKPYGPMPHGVRGINAYTQLMASDPEMAGEYGGYDGPHPPPNDLRLHHYTVRIVALDIPTLGLSGPFTGHDVEKAIQGHILAVGEDVGTFTANPNLKK